jgi:hypothetical protein
MVSVGGGTLGTKRDCKSFLLVRTSALYARTGRHVIYNSWHNGLALNLGRTPVASKVNVFLLASQNICSSLSSLFVMLSIFSFKKWTVS